MMNIPGASLRGQERLYPIQVLFGKGAGPLADGERGLLNLALPPFQRGEVWSDEQKRAFIEGSLLGFGLGTYVVNAADWDDQGLPKPCSGWLIDGQQRLTAIRDFVTGRLDIFDGQRYSDFTTAQRRSWHSRPFARFELNYTDDISVLAELYNRLNFGGTPHRPEEVAVPLKAARGPRL